MKGSLRPLNQIYPIGHLKIQNGDHLKMAAILHLQVGVGPKKIIKSNDMNAIGVLLSVLMATGTIFCSCVAIWKFKKAPFFKMAAILH